MSKALILRDYPEAGIARLTLNRPDSFNALSEEMLQALGSECEDLAGPGGTGTKVVIIAATGKAFSAGHDLKQMMAQQSLDYYRGLFSNCSHVMQSLQKLPQIVIAQVQGIATAAGCQLVAMCDLGIAAEHARFAVSGINLGLFCATPSVALVRSMHRKQAMYMLTTGDFVSAQQALAWGLINDVVPDTMLESETLALARKIAAKPAPALRFGKRLFYEQIEAQIGKAYQLAEETMAQNMMETSALEGIQAFIEKRPPSWSGK